MQIRFNHTASLWQSPQPWVGLGGGVKDGAEMELRYLRHLEDGKMFQVKPFLTKWSVKLDNICGVKKKPFLKESLVSDKYGKINWVHVKNLNNGEK